MRWKERIIRLLENSGSHTYERSRTARFGFALMVILAINLIRIPLLPWVGNPLPTLFVSPAIVCVTWFAGLGAGVFAVGLSFVSVAVFWMEPHFSFDLTMDQDWLAMLLFASTTLFLAFFTEMTRKALLLQKNTKEYLEKMVAERTAHLQETIAELEAFSYTVSHDLRSPLRAMQGFATIVAEENAMTLNAASKSYLGRISAAASRLDGLISDLMAFSKIGKEQLFLQSVDLNRLLRDILEQYPSIHESKAAIQIESPLLRVRAHPAYLTQALANLLDNAVKFSAPGRAPEIRIFTESCENGSGVQLNVQDKGIGIPGDQLQKIFLVFQRAHVQFEGTGIGLSIVKRAIEKMGGRVGVNSAPDKGSTFWIKLPAG
ncbi:MAG TPA: ATP-binding protein [Candidatus Saccharimonadales bacterium]|nr:ATP-binding protein [Candidatus Saccharimonadales bacterium]